MVQEENLKDTIRQVVIETIQAISMDPDFGLELRAWVKDRLKRSAGDLTSFEEVNKRYTS